MAGGQVVASTAGVRWSCSSGCSSVDETSVDRWYGRRTGIPLAVEPVAIIGRATGVQDSSEKLSFGLDVLDG
jgi:hypothetical protein